jgi:hypothetical protein
VAVVFPATASATPRCFGAAARDPQHACHNTALAESARPGLATSLLVPNFPCEGMGVFGDINDRASGAVVPCGFGASPTKAKRIVALIGDSHAMAWRAAVAAALKPLGWRGIDLTRSHCGFSATVRKLDEDAEVEGCYRFNARVITYLTDHPEITAAFVIHQTGGTPYFTFPGLGQLKSQVEGAKLAWGQLPESIAQVFVLRDNPGNHSANTVATCVHRARKARRRPGPFCARPRSEALYSDAFAVAARQLDDPRFALVNLTRHFCDDRNCFPVVGGVLVTKDGTHLTRMFSTTLGPYILRAVRHVLKASTPYAVPAS